MIDNSFSIGSRTFKVRKLDAFKQFHLVRKLGPVISKIIPEAQKALKAGLVSENPENLPMDQKLELMAKFGQPIMEGMAELSDKDADFVLIGLLSAVEIQQGPGWARVSNGEMVMIQDMELPLLFQLAGRAFMFNLSGFFGEPRSSS